MTKKKHTGLEYRMLIQPTYDETLKKDGTLFFLETVKQFSFFNYEIVLTESMEGKNIRWSLHGLRAPELVMPSVGPAQFRKIYYGLNGTYSFTLQKIDGKEITIELKISPSSVAVKTAAPHPFVSVYASASLFEERRGNESEKPVHKPDMKRSHSS